MYSDVALHSLTDAILGAIADGDIGTQFPPSDPEWRGSASWRFLAFAGQRVAQAGGRIDHLDLTIIAEAPKIGPHRGAMRTRIAAILALSPARISVKATTTERLGFRSEEHTSELQSLMRISYAVFCLKKKKNIYTTTTTIHNP